MGFHDGITYLSNGIFIFPFSSCTTSVRPSIFTNSSLSLHSCMQMILGLVRRGACIRGKRGEGGVFVWPGVDGLWLTAVSGYERRAYDSLIVFEGRTF